MKTSRTKAFILSFVMLMVTFTGVLTVPTFAEDTYKAEFGAQFNPDVNTDIGEWPDLSASNITFNAGEEAVITVEFDAPVAFAGNYAAIDTNFPASGIGEIISLKLDGNEIDMGSAFLNGEGIDGGLRLTICNKWNSDIDPQPVDVETLGEFSKIEIIFTVNEGEETGADEVQDTAFNPNAEYNATFGAQLNPEVNADVGEWPDLSGYNIIFKAGEEATITAEFDAPVAFAGNYAAIDTNFPASGIGEIVSLKLDGNEIDMGSAFLNNEGIDGGLRLTICNKWNSDIDPQPVDVETLGEFSKIEITFLINPGSDIAAETEAAEPAGETYDPNGVYHAYLGVQSKNFIFRNAWGDTSYGADDATWSSTSIGNNFNTLVKVGDDEGVYSGTFADAEIKGNGTYKVELTDFDFAGDDAFNLLFVSTDIPFSGENVKFSDVKVILNGSTKHTFDVGYMPGIDNNDKKEYYEVQCINIWNSDLGGDEGLFGYTMPNNSIAIEFTISGFAYDKAENADDNEASDSDSTPASSNNVLDENGLPVWSIVLIIIGAAAIIAIIIIIAKGTPKKSS